MRNASTPSSAHTEGPWVVDRQSPYSSLSVKQKYGIFICDLDCGETPSAEAEANARLIAKAPALEDALLVAQNFVRQQLIYMTPDSSDSQDAQWVLDTINKTLADDS